MSDVTQNLWKENLWAKGTEEGDKWRYDNVVTQQVGFFTAHWADDKGVRIPNRYAESPLADYGQRVGISGFAGGISPDVQYLKIDIINPVGRVVIKTENVALDRNHYFWMDFVISEAFYEATELEVECYAWVGRNAVRLHRNMARLELSIVSAIPIIMEAWEWPKAVKCQDVWRNGQRADHPALGIPQYNIITMDWVLSFARAQEAYDKIFSSDILKPNKIDFVDSVKREIHKMKRDGLCRFPTVLNEETSFGVFNMGPQQIRHTPQGQRSQLMPLIEKYYVQFYARKLELSDPLDDFMGAIGSLTFHIAVGGVIVKRQETDLVIIKKLGIYVKDGFDFVSERITDMVTAPLGYYRLSTRSISKNPLPGMTYVENRTYQNYQERKNKGMNFYNYSDVKMVDCDIPIFYPKDTFK